MTQTILITGVNGQVGGALAQAFAAQAATNLDSKMCLPNIVKLGRDALDLSNADAIREAVQRIKPQIIINPAAYTAVDKAETEPKLAYAINAIAPQILAEEAAKLNAKLIHFSTDYVYEGNQADAYVETDATNPLSIYGKSKLAGEIAIQKTGAQHLILRTAWVYGATGKNFLNTILRLAKERDALRIVADQFGTPTSSTSIANAVLALLPQWQTQQGIYHLVNAGETSWHGFATAIVEMYGALGLTPALKTQVADIAAIATADYPTPAARPANSRLNTAKLAQDFNVELCVWEKALSIELETLKHTA